MKKYLLLFCLSFLAVKPAHACQINFVADDLDNVFSFLPVFAVGGIVQFQASGCPLEEETEELEAEQFIWAHKNVAYDEEYTDFAEGEATPALRAGETVLEGRKQQQIRGYGNRGTSQAFMDFFVGASPEKPTIVEVGQCRVDPATGRNVARIKLTAEDTDPISKSKINFRYPSKINGFPDTGLARVESTDGTFDGDIQLELGSNQLYFITEKQYFPYRDLGPNEFFDVAYGVFSGQTEKRTIVCNGVQSDDLAEDGSPLSEAGCSGSDNGKVSKGKPVSVACGKTWHENLDFSLRGRSDNGRLELKRTYRSSTANTNNDFGTEWTHSFQTRINVYIGAGSSKQVVWTDESGNPWRFLRINGNESDYRQPGGQRGNLFGFPDRYELRKEDNTVYIFDLEGRLTTLRDKYGVEKTFTYTGDKLASVSSPFAGTISFTRDNLGRIVQSLNERDNLSIYYTYHADGKLASVTDYLNNTYHYTYVKNMPNTKAQGLLESIKDPVGRLYRFTYYPDGKAYQQFEPGGGVRTFVYNEFSASAKKKKVGLANVAQSEIVGSTEVTEIDGTKTTYFYDRNRRTVRTQFTDGSSVSKAYNGDGFLAVSTDAMGFSTIYQYDDNENISLIQRPAHSSPTQITYDQTFNIPTNFTPPVGAATGFQLDGTTGDILQQTRVSGNSTLSLSFTRDAFGNLLSTNNGKVSYADQRDGNGFLTYQFDAHNPQTMTYDSRGRISTRSWASGRSVSYTYDDYGRVVAMVDSHGPDMQKTYDAVGRTLSETMTDGQVVQTTKFQWDTHDRLVSQTNAKGETTVFSYEDSAGRILPNPTAVTDPQGKTTRYIYDSMLRLIRKIEPKGGEIRYTYDKRGDVASVTDPVGNVTYFSYDANGRKVREDRPSVVGSQEARHVITYEYDDADRMIKEEHHSFTGGESRIIEMQYDGFNRLTRKILKKGNTIEDDAVFSYENQMDADLILAANNQTANLGFNYNPAPPFSVEGFSQLAANQANPLELIEEEFTVGKDVTGNISSVVGSVRGTIFTKTYDPAGRLTGVDAGGLKTAIQYDGFGRRKFLSHSDGKTQSTSYDQLNRITQIQWQENGKKSVEQYLNYDAAGNIINMAREHSKFEFRYDQNDQLVQTRFQGMNGMPNLNRSHQYDFVGNRIKDSKNGVGEFLGNFLLKNEESNFTPDPDGFGQTIEEQTGDQSKKYSYRADGKISSFQSGNLFVTYHYDAFDRLVAKSINKDGSPFTNTFVHLAKQSRVLLGKAGNGEVTKYIDGTGVAERLGEVKGTQGKGYITDHLGSVLNTEAGGVVRLFDSFGRGSIGIFISRQSSPVIYGYTGHALDAESENYRTKYRQYSSYIGSWFTQDPAGFLNGEGNLYRYVRNRPFNFVDRFGRDAESPSPKVPPPSTDPTVSEPGPDEPSDDTDERSEQEERQLEEEKESFWDAAKRIAKKCDPRERVKELRERMDEFWKNMDPFTTPDTNEK